MDKTNFSSAKETVKQLNAEIQNASYTGDLWILIEDVPNKIEALAGFIRTEIQNDDKALEYFTSMSIKWLTNAVENLKSSGTGIDEERRLLELFLAKRYARDAANLFLTHFDRFCKASILN